MENLNEGKKKSPSYMAELAEIDKQSAIVAMEAKINHLQEMTDKKKDKLKMVSEDENLSDLIDPKRKKMMEREIKEIEKAKMKLEKLYEKMSGDKKKEVVGEEMDELPQSILDKEKYEIERDAKKLEEDGLDETYGSTTYEEDDSKIDEGGYDSTYEEDDSVKEETNEEVDRFRKLAGIPLKEDLIDSIKNIKDYNKTQDSLKYKKYDVTYDKDEKMYSVFLKDHPGDSSDMPEFESSNPEKVKNFLKP